MTTSCYRVIQCGDAWTIRSGNRTFGPLSGWQSRPPRESFGARGREDVASRLDLWTRPAP
jgi:hypothetical protein